MTAGNQRQTVAELPHFTKQSSKLLTADERLDLVSYLSEHPKSGDLIEGTGGVRKLRWSRAGRGKSAGARVIYYYHSDVMPLYLLTLFAKGEKADLNAAEKNQLSDLVGILTAIWKNGGLM